MEHTNNSFKEIIATVVSLLFEIWACIGGLRGIKKAYKLAGKKGYVSELINCNICIIFFEFIWWLVAKVYSIFDNDFQITINKFIVIKIILVCIMAINTIIIYLSARNMNSNTMEKNEINEVNKENNY